jgi:hypothetical protein
MKSNYAIKTLPESGVLVILEGNITRLFFDFSEEEQTMENDPETYHDCENVDATGREYGQLIAAIVNDRYSQDDVQALISNYESAKDTESDITDAKRTEYISEYQSFQAWRAHAKEIAKKAVTEISKLEK